MKKTKKLPLFWKIYFIAFGLIAVLLTVLLIVGYNFMVEYDRVETFPTNNANNYAKTLTKGSYGLLCSDNTNAACVFENAEYTKVISEKLAGSKIVCSKSKPTKVVVGDKLFEIMKPYPRTFKIEADGENIAYIGYKSKPNAGGFGLSGYDFDHVYSLVKGEYAIDIVIPSDATAFLNNVKVDSTWVKESNIKEIYDVSSNLYGEVGTVSETTYTRYSVEGLFNEPNLVVTDKDGKHLTVTYNSELKAFCTIQNVIYILAPDNFNVSVNGIDITNQDRFIIEKDVEFKELSVIKQYMTSEIKMTKYIVSGVDSSSVNVVATNYSGLQTPVYLDTEKGYYRVYNCMLNSADKDKLLGAYGLTEDRLVQFAKYYAEFVANDNDRWSTIMPYVMKGSEVYSTFDSFWSVLADHNSFWYEDVKVKDISFYAEDTISCRTSFVYWIKGFAGKPDATESYPTDVTFYYVRKDGRWYISDWELHTEG